MSAPFHGAVSVMPSVLQVLANPNNQRILDALLVEPGYARKIANLLDMKESEVTRRLRLLESAGLVSSAWENIGKNVKLYRLQADGLSVRFTPGGLEVALDGVRRRDDVVVASSAQRIPPVDLLAGRDDELQALDRSGVHVIAGMPGIGKTTLMAAHARRQERPVFWHSFRGIESLTWLANRLGVFAAEHGDRRLLEALRGDVEPADLRALLLDVLDSGLAVYFDDVQQIQDEHVQRFVDDAVQTNGMLYISSRTGLFAAKGRPHVHEMTLHGLDDDAVAAVLAHDGADVGDDLVRRLRPMVGGHPLALHLLTATAHQMGLDVEAVVSRAEDGRVADLQAYLLQALDAGLTDPQRRVLTTASIFRTGFDIDALRAVATKRIHEKDVMDLVKDHLVVDRGDVYDLHDIVRTFFGQMLDDARPMHAAAAAHFLDQGNTEARIEAMHHLLAAERRHDVLKLVSENLDVREYDFIDAGYAQLYLDMLDLFTEADVRGADQWAVILDEKGDVHFSQGNYAESVAYHEAARDQVRDGEEAADIGWKLALALHRLGDGDAAREAVAAALAQEPVGRTKERLDRLAKELSIPA